MALRFAVSRRPAPASEVDAAIARLDRDPGIYLGCDAGVPGLHPLQATLLVAPSLALRVFADGAEVEALDTLGDALLRDPALAAFVAATGRGRGRSAVAAARAFLAAFDRSADALLIGALGFEAHRLASDPDGRVDAGPADAAAPEGGVGSAAAAEAEPAPGSAPAAEAEPAAGSAPTAAPKRASSRVVSGPLGILFFASRLLRRNDAGDWDEVTLRFIGPAFDRDAREASDDGRPAHPRDAADAREHDHGAWAAVDGAADAVDSSRGRATDTRAGGAAGASASPSARPSFEAPAPLAAEDDFPPGGYAKVVGRAVQRLAREPLVSLTLSQSFRRAVGADVSAARAFAALRAANPAPAVFFVNTGRGERLFGASPDLQLVVRGRELESLPVCGTVARGHGPVGEAESLRRLLDEEVDAASLAVCTDALRNDLAPLCVPGSLRLRDRRRPLALATVVHAVDRLSGRLRDGVDAWDAIVATAAPVMVTGTPRRLALAAIEALEAGPRGWYGGLALQVASNGDAIVGTILRAAVIHDGVAEVRAGGDLMADSDPAREEHESRVKAVSLWRALGMPVDAGLQRQIAGGEPGAGGEAGVAMSRPALPAAVALRDAGDPFGAAVAETLQGLGLALDPDARPVVLIGAGTPRGAGDVDSGAVAIGDAAARVLEGAAFAVIAIAPAHGRLMQCRPVAVLPGVRDGPFTAMRYATLAPGQAPAGGAFDAMQGPSGTKKAMTADARQAAKTAEDAQVAQVAEGAQVAKGAKGAEGAEGAKLADVAEVAEVAGAVPSSETAMTAAALGWDVWVVDDRGEPAVLAHAEHRTVCMLLRPESLLSDAVARDLLRTAIAFAATPAGHA